MKSFDANALPIDSTNDKNCSFVATKSVCELTSKITVFVPLVAVPITPSAAIAPAFLAALAAPLSCNHAIAASTSWFVAVKAFLQSRNPAPVLSLSSFTNNADI